MTGVLLEPHKGVSKSNGLQLCCWSFLICAVIVFFSVNLFYGLLGGFVDTGGLMSPETSSRRNFITKWHTLTEGLARKLD